MSTYGLSILGTGFHTVWASEFYSRLGLGSSPLVLPCAQQGCRWPRVRTT